MFKFSFMNDHLCVETKVFILMLMKHGVLWKRNWIRDHVISVRNKKLLRVMKMISKMVKLTSHLEIGQLANPE